MENREIPNGWIETTLGEVAEIIDGDRGINYPNGDDFSTNGYCLFLNTKNVPNTQFSFSEKIFITKEKDEMLRKGKLQRGDFVLTTRGTIGNFAFYSDKVAFENIRINSGMVILRINQDAGFFKHFLSSNLFKSQTLSLQSGSAQPQLPIRDLKTFLIILPPLPEQKAIADVLSSLDEKIELLEEENKTLETLAQTIFTEWFVNFNFPGATGEMEDSELGEIPKGWRVGKLGEFISIKHGYAFKGSDFIEKSTDRIILTPGNFKIGGGFKSDKFKYLDENIQFPREYIFNENDLVVTMTDLSKLGDTLGYPAFIPKLETNTFLHNQRIGKIEYLKENFNKYYLYFIMCSRNYRGTILGSATGSTVKHTAPGRIQEHKIAISNNELIEHEFNKIIKPVMHKVFSNNEQIQTLKTTRDTLLPKLMSGEIRVEGFGG